MPPNNSDRIVQEYLPRATYMWRCGGGIYYATIGYNPEIGVTFQLSKSFVRVAFPSWLRLLMFCGYAKTRYKLVAYVKHLPFGERVSIWT